MVVVVVVVDVGRDFLPVPNSWSPAFVFCFVCVCVASKRELVWLNRGLCLLCAFSRDHYQLVILSNRAPDQANFLSFFISILQSIKIHRLSNLRSASTVRTVLLPFTELGYKVHIRSALTHLSRIPV